MVMDFLAGLISSICRMHQATFRTMFYARKDKDVSQTTITSSPDEFQLRYVVVVLTPIRTLSKPTTLVVFASEAFFGYRPTFAFVTSRLNKAVVAGLTVSLLSTGQTRKLQNKSQNSPIVSHDSS